MEKLHFNVSKFYAALDAQRIAKGMSWRQVASDACVSPSTFTRLSQGKYPDAENFTSIVIWLGLDIATFIDERKRESTETLAQIASSIYSDACLTSEHALLLDTLVKTTYKVLCHDSQAATST